MVKGNVISIFNEILLALRKLNECLVVADLSCGFRTFHLLSSYWPTGTAEINWIDFTCSESDFNKLRIISIFARPAGHQGSYGVSKPKSDVWIGARSSTVKFVNLIGLFENGSFASSRLADGQQRPTRLPSFPGCRNILFYESIILAPCGQVLAIAVQWAHIA